MLKNAVVGANKFRGRTVHRRQRRVCLSSLRPQTDELVVVVAIEVRGAHAPSHAVAGASPTTFPGCAREAFRRGAEMGTRGRVRSPEKRSRIPQRTLKQLRNGASLRDRRWQAFRFGASFFVQGFGKFLQAGNDLRRLGQDRRGQFFGVIWPALRHFRKRHHHGEGVIHGMLNLAVLGLELFQLFVGNAARFFTHCASISVEKVNPCA